MELFSGFQSSEPVSAACTWTGAMKYKKGFRLYICLCTQMCSCRIVGFYSVLDKLPNDATYTMRSTRLTFGGMEYCGYTVTQCSKNYKFKIEND